MFPIILLFVFIIALIVCLIGFYKYIYFISLGYGFSIAVIGAYLLLLYKNTADKFSLLLAILLILYGLRLGLYLLIREIKSSSYNKHMTKEIKDGKYVSLFVKIMIWISSAILYTCQTSPVIYRLNGMIESTILTRVGAFIMIFGLIFESIADIQKSISKKKNPNTFCKNGLYKIVRCPNYLGEMIFWTGLFITCLDFIKPGQLVIVLLGYLGIIYIMFSGARRLEIRQNKNYGDDKEYKKYIKTVPILLPIVPLYSVEKYTFLKG